MNITYPEIDSQNEKNFLSTESNKQLNNCFGFGLYVLKSFVCLLQEKFAGVDIRVRVSGGGHVAQIYAIRQAISKALIAFYQKCK